MNTKQKFRNQSSDNSAVWKGFIADTGAKGLMIRQTVPEFPDGVRVFLEHWQAGTSETPHFHPGDDMTVMVEGKMAIQFYTQSNGSLSFDGDKVILSKGDTGYIMANRIHSAEYIDDCKIVYVHDHEFGETPVGE